MTTWGLTFAIHSFDFSNPEKTRFQYGSSVCLLSIAAPMAGTCDEAIPAMILATAYFRFFCEVEFAVLLATLGLLAGLPLPGTFPDLERLPSTERPPASIIAA